MCVVLVVCVRVCVMCLCAACVLCVCVWCVVCVCVCMCMCVCVRDLFGDGAGDFLFLAFSFRFPLELSWLIVREGGRCTPQDFFGALQDFPEPTDQFLTLLFFSTLLPFFSHFSWCYHLSDRCRKHLNNIKMTIDPQNERHKYTTQGTNKQKTNKTKNKTTAKQ